MNEPNSQLRLQEHGVYSIPQGWSLSKVKYLADYINGYPFKPNDWGEIGKPILRIQNLSDPTGIANKYNGTLSERYLVKTGDLLISWSASLGVYEWIGEEAWLNQHIFKVNLCKEKVTTPYFKWLAEWFISELAKDAHGSTMLHLTKDAFGSFPLLLPLKNVQARIAQFLDVETARIDSLIAAKETHLMLIAEKRRALITTVVTRGIDSSVRLKESGVSWLGLVPVHWEVTRAKNLFREIDQRSTTGEETLLSLRMQRGLVPHNDVSDKVIPSEELIGYKIAEPNQIVVNRMRAASGLIAIVPQPGIVSPDYAVFEPKDEVNPEYYTYLFTTPLLQAVFRSESKGLGTGSSGFLRLYSDNFHAISMPKPPTAEQSAITKHIQTETAKLDELKAATERTITLLRERRSTLIAAAVTGKVMVEENHAN